MQGTIKAGTYGQRYFRQQQARITQEARGREREIKSELRKATKPKERKEGHKFAVSGGRTDSYPVQQRHRDAPDGGRGVEAVLAPYGGARRDPPLEGNLGEMNRDRAREIQLAVNTMPLVQDTRELQRIRDEIQASREIVEEEEEEEEEEGEGAWDREERQDEEGEEVGADPTQGDQEVGGEDEEDLAGLDLGEDVDLGLLPGSENDTERMIADVREGGDPIRDVDFEPEPEPEFGEEEEERWKPNRYTSQPGDYDPDDSKWAKELQRMVDHEARTREGMERLGQVVPKRSKAGYTHSEHLSKILPQQTFQQQHGQAGQRVSGELPEGGTDARDVVGFPTEDAPELTKEEQEAVAQGEGLGYDEMLDFAGTTAPYGTGDAPWYLQKEVPQAFKTRPQLFQEVKHRTPDRSLDPEEPTQTAPKTTSLAHSPLEPEDIVSRAKIQQSKMRQTLGAQPFRFPGADAGFGEPPQGTGQRDPEFEGFEQLPQSSEDEPRKREKHLARQRDISLGRLEPGFKHGTKMPLEQYKWKKRPKRDGGGFMLDVGAKGAKPTKEYLELQRGRVIDTRPGMEGKKIQSQAPSREDVRYRDIPPREYPMKQIHKETGEISQVGSLVRHPKTRRVLRRMQEGDPEDPKDISTTGKPTIYQRYGSGRFATGEEITEPSVYSSAGRVYESGAGRKKKMTESAKPARESWGLERKGMDPALEAKRSGTEGYRQIKAEGSKIATAKRESEEQSKRYQKRAREADEGYRPSDIKGAYGGFNYGSGVDEWTTKEKGRSALGGASYEGDLGASGDPTSEEVKAGTLSNEMEYEAMKEHPVARAGIAGGGVSWKDEPGGFTPQYTQAGMYRGLHGTHPEPRFPTRPDRPVYQGGANVPRDPSQMVWTGGEQTEAEASAEIARLERLQDFGDDLIPADFEPEPEPEWGGFAPLQPSDFGGMDAIAPTPPTHFDPNPTMRVAVEGDETGFTPGTRYSTHRFDPSLPPDGQYLAQEQERRRQARTHQFHPSRDRRG